MKHKNTPNPGHDPPFSELFSSEFDPAQLEIEYRESLADGVNQARLAEFLVAGDPETVDFEALEREDRAAQQDLFRQEQLQEAEARAQEQEALSKASPFFDRPQPTIPVPPALPSTPREVPPPTASAGMGVPPPKRPTLNLLASGAGDPKRPTPYEAAEWIIEHVHVVHANGLLYFYDGTAYLSCKRDEAKKRIMDACRPAVKAIGNARFVQQVYDLLMMEPRICRDADLFRNLVAFDDGVLDLDTGQFQPHSPALFVTTRLRASYRRGCETDCLVFKKFLADVSCGDSLLVQRLWECVAYLLVPDQTGKKFVLFQGVANSGKSVLGNFIQGCFVGDVATTLEINELRGNFTLADLVGRKFCSDMDIPANPLNAKALGKLKKMTGQDTISSDVKFADRVNFVCTAKFLFGTNHAVLTQKSDPAFFKRLVVVPFRRSFSGKDQDYGLPQKLAGERSAIIARALAAYQHLRQNGFQFAGNFQVNEVCGCEAPESPVDAVMSFLMTRCELAEGVWTPTKILFDDFRETFGPLCGDKRFSELLNHAISIQNLPAKKGRDRLTPDGNPKQGFCGLRLK